MVMFCLIAKWSASLVAVSAVVCAVWVALACLWAVISLVRRGEFGLAWHEFWDDVWGDVEEKLPRAIPSPVKFKVKIITISIMTSLAAGIGATLLWFLYLATSMAC